MTSLILACGAIALPLSWDRSGLLFLGLVGGTEGISSYDELLELNAAGGLSGAEREELRRSQREAECFMLRKAQAAVLLRWRGFQVVVAACIVIGNLHLVFNV
jgi:hypothetical protein